MVDGCPRKLVHCVRSVSGKCFGSTVVHLHTPELFSVVESKLYGYALVAVVLFPSERVAVTVSINRDLTMVSGWCDLWGMKLNASKTKTMIVSRSCMVHPQLTPSTLDVTVLKESADKVMLALTFNAKMTFEKHLRCVSSAADDRLGFMRKSLQVFHD